MYLIRKGIDRGHANHGWLDARHTFSFGQYHHPDHMGFRSLRVINEDRVTPGAGFPPHGHQDMEIVTYPLEGTVAHKDSTGGGGFIRPGEVQYMSAGTGVEHSEFNGSEADPLHLLQIWLLPDRASYEPRYEQRDFSSELSDGFRLIVSRDGRDGSIRMRQDADLFASRLKTGEVVSYDFAPGRFGYLQVARGGVQLGETMLQAGDGVKIADELGIALSGLSDDAEVLLFDLA